MMISERDVESMPPPPCSSSMTVATSLHYFRTITLTMPNHAHPSTVKFYSWQVVLTTNDGDDETLMHDNVMEGW